MAKIFVSGGQFGQTRKYYILTMNYYLNSHYLFGKWSIIVKLHDMTNKLLGLEIGYLFSVNRLTSYLLLGHP